MKDNLSIRLIVMLGFGLICISAGQIITRTYIELPSLLQLEKIADGKDVERVQRILRDHIETLENDAVSYGAWDDAYTAMTTGQLDSVLRDHINSIYFPLTYFSLSIQGILFINTQKEVVYSSLYDPISGKLTEKDTLEIDSLSGRALTQIANPRLQALINSGASQSNIGPVIYAASKIVSTDLPHPETRGTLIFWRSLNDDYFSSIEKSFHTRLTAHSIEEVRNNEKLSSLTNTLYMSNPGFLPRDKANQLSWLINDNNGAPLLFIQQLAGQRSFNDSWLSESFLVGFGVSGLVIIAFSLFFSRTLINRVSYAKKLMTEIVTNNDYKRRLITRSKDEIDLMFDKFNKLLSHIESQEAELKEKNQKLELLTQQDALTGIPNRRYLDETLDRCWRLCVRNSRYLSVLMIDIDYFKAYNDHYGHQSGDQILKQVAQTLQNNLHRATDYLARYGGEEFCVVLTDTRVEQAILVGERLRSAIESMQIINKNSGCSDVVTISIGVSSIVATTKNAVVDIVKAADSALYKAKEQGRNGVFLEK